MARSIYHKIAMKTAQQFLFALKKLKVKVYIPSYTPLVGFFSELVSGLFVIGALSHHHQ